MVETLTGILIIAIIVVVYIGTYVMNRKMPAPYQKIDDATCGACTNYSCGLKQNLSEER